MIHKQFNLQGLFDSRYRQQFCVDPSIIKLDNTIPENKEYVFYITGIFAPGAWTASINGFHKDNRFRNYTMAGTGNLFLTQGMEVIAHEASFTGVSLVKGFTMRNMSFMKE